MNFKNYFFILLLLSLTVVSYAQEVFPLPNHSSTFTGNTRGYWFVAPTDFTITSLRVPTDASTDDQSIVVMKFPSNPPYWSSSTTNYTTEFLAQDVAGAEPIACEIPVAAGEIIGILGSRGSNSANSYGQSPYNTSLAGYPVTIERLLMQNDLESTWPYPVSAEGSGSTGRVEFTYKVCSEYWSDTNLGTASGDAEYEDTDVFEVASNGLSWGITDNTHMIYQELCGDVEIEAQLLDVSNFGSAGLMIRESMDAGAKKVAINRQQFGSFVKSAIRQTTNGFGLMSQVFRPNQYWLKLVRNGNTFTGYTSVDGETWGVAFTTSVSMNSCLQVGLYVESPISVITSVAHFANVCANGTAPLPPLVEDIGNTLVQSQSKADGNFDMFPNPAADLVTLDMEMFMDQDVELSVFNQLGQAIYHTNLDQVVNKYHQFDSSNWPKGMYIVKLSSESGQEISHKLIVQRKNK